jgi:hypothetical protein
MENAENGARHQIPVTTSTKILKHFTFGPTISLTDLWYLKKLILVLLLTPLVLLSAPESMVLSRKNQAKKYKPFVIPSYLQ